MTDPKSDSKKDWKKIARSSGISIPEPALDRIAQTLDALEADFRPLVRALPLDSQPALHFSPIAAPPPEEAA